LKNIAVGRLVLDNIPHVKTHWPMVTPFISQVALTFGCDDLEGTVVFERVYHEAGAGTPMWLSYDQIVTLIRGAGKEPVERDSLYRTVRTFEDWVPGQTSARPRARKARPSRSHTDPGRKPGWPQAARVVGGRGRRRMRLGRIGYINCYRSTERSTAESSRSRRSS